MPTTTKGFRYPALTDVPNVPQDVQNLAADVDAYFDTAKGFTVVCTSTTRPASPVQGVVILETDTGNRYYWSGSYWRGIGPLTCTSATRPTNQLAGQVIYETDTVRTLVFDGTNWQRLHTRVAYAHMGKTNGFQAITSGTPTVVTMSAAQVLEGGFTFDDANDALVVPFTGTYRMTMQYYATGGADYGIVAWLKLVTGDVTYGQVTDRKVGGINDVSKTTSVIRSATAGDKFRVMCQHDGGGGSAWGTDGYMGVFLNMEFLG